MSTDHCTLCDQALDVLTSMPELRGLALVVVDVAQDTQLTERYGERLPVLLFRGRELSWPFTGADLRDWLAGIRSDREIRSDQEIRSE
jgi:hypothetical protein